jgi:hypothetical protein
MPLAIFLFLGRSLAVRLRLEQHGCTVQAIVTSVRGWTDSLDGIRHQTVSYRFSVDCESYSCSADVPIRGKGYAAGDRFPIIYLPSQPAKAQPVSGGPATSVGLTAFVMLAMVVVVLWMASLF